MPHAEPARPVLASTLWEDAQRFNASPLTTTALTEIRSRNDEVQIDVTLNVPWVDGRPSKRRKTTHAECRTGCREIDLEVLDGGLPYGRGGVVGVACQEVRMGLELAYATLTNHLVTHPGSRAFYIDTSKTFDPRRLHRSLTLELRPVAQKQGAATGVTHDGGYVYRRREAYPAGGIRHDLDELIEDGNEGEKVGEKKVAVREDLEAEVIRAMNRVSVIRVFDLEGLMDAVMEVRERLSNGPSRDAVSITSHGQAGAFESLQKQAHDSVTPPAAPEPPLPPEPPPRLEVPDSDADTSDEEMLLDLPTEAKTSPPSKSPLKITVDTPPKTLKKPKNSETSEKSDPQSPGPTLLVLPSLGQLLSPLMSQNHVRAHALLVQLQRRLHGLTLEYPLLCLQLNSTVSLGLSASAPTSNPAPADGNEPVRDPRGDLRREPHSDAMKRQAEETPSAFAAVRLKPALGRTYAGFLDLGCLITAAEGRDGKRECVFEVLSDREGDRVGRWCSFDGSGLGR